jgi:hypothetical protein
MVGPTTPGLGSAAEVPGCVRPTGVGNAVLFSGIKCRPYGSSLISGCFIAGGAPRNEVAVDGKPVVPNEGVVVPKVELPKLGVVPKLPKLPKVDVVLGVEKLDPKLGVENDEPPNETPPVPPNEGIVVDEKVLGVEPNDPNVPEPNDGFANDEPKFDVVPEPKPPMFVVLPKPPLKGEEEVEGNIELEVPEPNEPKPVEGVPKAEVPKLVAGVELKAPKPVPNEGVVVGVVPKLDPKPEAVPNGEDVEPNELPVPNGEDAEKGLDELPNMLPVVPKGEAVMLLPNGEELGMVLPKVLAAVPKGEPALGVPPRASNRSSSKLLLA